MLLPKQHPARILLALALALWSSHDLLAQPAAEPSAPPQSAAPSPALSTPPAKGVLIELKRASKAKADAWYEKKKLRLLRRSEGLSFDWVTPAEQAKANDDKALSAICDQAIRLDFVRSCVLNTKVPAHAQAAEKNANCVSCTGESDAQRIPDALSQAAKALDVAGRCSLTPEFGEKRYFDGSLSPFWAQELVGGDLAHDLVEGDAAAAIVPVGVVDVGLIISEPTGKAVGGPQELSRDRISEDVKQAFAAPEKSKLGALDLSVIGHGNSTANLIVGPQPAGIGAKTRLEEFDQVNWYSDYQKILDSKRPVRSKLVNLSMGVDSPVAIAAMKKLSASSICVLASGNSFPHGFGKHQVQAPAIVVGSLSPIGTVSSFSQEDDSVTIAAPSEWQLKSVAPSRFVLMGYSPYSYVDYGGTSGATPLVTAAIANAMSYLPELTLEETKLLLKRTAIPMNNSLQEPRRNGAGMLNAYQLARVAQRLKARGWPKDRAKLLAEPAIYDFSEEAQQALRKGQTLLVRSDCGSRQEGFRLMRASFLLNPSAETRAELKAAYQRDGRTFEALAMDSHQPDFPERVMKEYRRLRAIDGGKAARHLLQFLPRLGEKAVPIISEAASDPSSLIRDGAYIAALYLGDRGTPLLRQAFEKEPAFTKTLILNRIGDLQDPAREEFIALGENSPEPAVKSAAQKARRRLAMPRY